MEAKQSLQLQLKQEKKKTKKRQCHNIENHQIGGQL